MADSSSRNARQIRPERYLQTYTMRFLGSAFFLAVFLTLQLCNTAPTVYDCDSSPDCSDVTDDCCSSGGYTAYYGCSLSESASCEGSTTTIWIAEESCEEGSASCFSEFSLNEECRSTNYYEEIETGHNAASCSTAYSSTSVSISANSRSCEEGRRHASHDDAYGGGGVGYSRGGKNVQYNSDSEGCSNSWGFYNANSCQELEAGHAGASDTWAVYDEDAGLVYNKEYVDVKGGEYDAVAESDRAGFCAYDENSLSTHDHNAGLVEGGYANYADTTVAGYHGESGTCIDEDYEHDSEQNREHNTDYAACSSDWSALMAGASAEHKRNALAAVNENYGYAACDVAAGGGRSDDFDYGRERHGETETAAGYGIDANYDSGYAAAYGEGSNKKYNDNLFGAENYHGEKGACAEGYDEEHGSAHAGGYYGEGTNINEDAGHDENYYNDVYGGRGTHYDDEAKATENFVGFGAANADHESCTEDAYNQDVKFQNVANQDFGAAANYDEHGAAEYGYQYTQGGAADTSTNWGENYNKDDYCIEDEFAEYCKSESDSECYENEYAAGDQINANYKRNQKTTTQAECVIDSCDESSICEENLEYDENCAGDVHVKQGTKTGHQTHLGKTTQKLKSCIETDEEFCLDEDFFDFGHENARKNWHNNEGYNAGKHNEAANTECYAQDLSTSGHAFDFANEDAFGTAYNDVNYGAAAYYTADEKTDFGENTCFEHAANSEDHEGAFEFANWNAEAENCETYDTNEFGGAQTLYNEGDVYHLNVDTNEYGGYWADEVFDKQAGFDACAYEQEDYDKVIDQNTNYDENNWAAGQAAAFTTANYEEGGEYHDRANYDSCEAAHESDDEFWGYAAACAEEDYDYHALAIEDSEDRANAWLVDVSGHDACTTYNSKTCETASSQTIYNYDYLNKNEEDALYDNRKRGEGGFYRDAWSRNNDLSTSNANGICAYDSHGRELVHAEAGEYIGEESNLVAGNNIHYAGEATAWDVDYLNYGECNDQEAAYGSKSAYGSTTDYEACEYDEAFGAYGYYGGAHDAYDSEFEACSGSDYSLDYSSDEGYGSCSGSEDKYEAVIVYNEEYCATSISSCSEKSEDYASCEGYVYYNDNAGYTCSSSRSKSEEACVTVYDSDSSSDDVTCYVPEPVTEECGCS